MKLGNLTPNPLFSVLRPRSVVARGVFSFLGGKALPVSFPFPLGKGVGVRLLGESTNLNPEKRA